MKKIIYIGIVFIIGLCAACSDMNDSMEPYLSKGEIIYIAKSDSVKTFAGRDRFLVRFWMSDPRATELYIYWSQRNDSLVVSLPEGRNKADSIDVYIGKEEGITEGSYSLELVTRDKQNNKSVTDEYIVNVYGDLFANTLLTRFIKTAKYDTKTSEVTIIWGGSYSAKEYGVRLFYKSKNGNEMVETFTAEALKKGVNTQYEDEKNTLVLKDLDIKEPLIYETLYLPEPTAIDTFYTEKNPITITGLPK